MKDCPTEFCICRDHLNDPNFIACQDDVVSDYNACIIGCPPGDFDCLSNCNRIYEENMAECPCEKNCPGGCPCPNFDCPVTTTTTALAKTTTPRTTQF